MIVMPYLSNSCIISLVEKMTGVMGFSGKYDEYSFFIHTYAASWQVMPFSSVLEVKILKYEIKDLRINMGELLTKYIKLI